MNRRFVVRRLLLVVPTVIGIVTFAFMLVHLAPGDAAMAFAGEGADQSQIDAARTYLGLDRPLHEQYLTYAGRVLTGDLGQSFSQRQPVLDLIGMRVRPTLLLTGTALVVSTLGGLGLGVISGRRPRGAVDAGINLGALIAYSLPAFWLAQVLVLTVAVHAELLPAAGLNDARAAYTGWPAVVDTARHLILPALVLTASEIALLLRTTRSGLVAERGKEYMRAGRAKGVRDADLLSRHALPNALLPVITVVGSRVGFLVSGAVLVESVFAWPGLGRLLVEAAQAGDHALILGMVMLIALWVTVANLITDLAYGFVDPRIRHR